MKKTIELWAGTSSSGRPVYEEVLVHQREPDTYEVLASPGLVLGIAAGDTIRTTAPGQYEMIARGGNFCVQIYRGQSDDGLEELANRMLAPIQGRLDGKSPQQLVYTIPVAAGFPEVERILGQILEKFPGAEWFFGNVYDPTDGVTPLNWWKPT